MECCGRGVLEGLAKVCAFFAVLYIVDAKRLPETDGRKFGLSAQTCLWHTSELNNLTNSIGALAVSESSVKTLFEARRRQRGIARG